MPTFSNKITEDIMPTLNKHKRLALTLRTQILQNGYKGDTNGAIEDSLALTGYGSRMMGKCLLIEQLVAIAIEAHGHKSIYYLLKFVLAKSILPQGYQIR